MSNNKKIDINALVEGLISISEYPNSDFVYVSSKKQALHPGRYFRELFLPELRKKGLSDDDTVVELGISAQNFQDFLNDKATVTLSLAKKLKDVTGMPVGFWLRAQSKFDDSDNRID